MIRCMNSFWFSKFFVDNKFDEVSSRKIISTTTGHCSGAEKKEYKIQDNGNSDSKIGMCRTKGEARTQVSGVWHYAVHSRLE